MIRPRPRRDRRLRGAVIVAGVLVFAFAVTVLAAGGEDVWANVARAFVVLFGGIVAGLGAPILSERAEQCRATGDQAGVRASLLLLGLNFGVMSYIALTLFGRYDAPLTWRVFLGLLVFVAKARMLSDIRRSTLWHEAHQRPAVWYEAHRPTGTGR